MKIRWTPRAIANLVALRTFIERESEQRAGLVVERIMESIEILADQRTIGRARKLEGTREFVVPPLHTGLSIGFVKMLSN